MSEAEPPIRPRKRQKSMLTPSLYMIQVGNFSLKLTWMLVGSVSSDYPSPLAKISGITDFAEDDKAWRRPGTDLSDYFNYGFDEFTWASYCLKQKTLRQEVAQSKTQMQDMQGFLGMPGGASMGMGSGPSGADLSPEMMQMMSQMMAQGLNPQEMNPDAFMQQMMQSQGATGGAMGQNYGSAQGYGQQGQNQQQMGYNYGGAGGGRNQGGRGRRNW